MSRLRRPDPAHAQKNGFRESVVVDNDNDDVVLRNVRLAHYILAHKGSYLPSPETLRKLGEAADPPRETVNSLTEKIGQLRKQHLKDLETLFKFQLAEYHQELVDHRICHDVSPYMVIDEAYPDQVAFKNALQDLDTRVLKMDSFKRDMDDALSTLRYTYLKTLSHLVARRSALNRAARYGRDQTFPQTAQQYYSITERDVQLRVARFLTSSSTEQTRMMDEFKWPSRAVQPLVAVYKSNPAFRSDVRDALSGLHVTDPRRRAKPSEDAPVFTRFSPVS